MLDDGEMRARLREILNRTTDPVLKDLIWDYREGKCSSRELMSHPAFAAEMRAELERAVTELGRQGGSLAEVQAETRAALQSEGIESPQEADDAAGDDEDVPPRHDGPDVLR